MEVRGESGRGVGCWGAFVTLLFLLTQGKARRLSCPSSSTWPQTGRGRCGRCWRTGHGWRPWRGWRRSSGTSPSPSCAPPRRAGRDPSMPGECLGCVPQIPPICPHFPITDCPLPRSYNFLAAGRAGAAPSHRPGRHSLRDSSVFSPPGRPRRRFFGVSAAGGCPGEPPRGQLLLHQVTLEPPAALEVTLESGSAAGRRRGRLAGPALSAALARHAAAFERRLRNLHAGGAGGVPPAAPLRPGRAQRDAGRHRLLPRPLPAALRAAGRAGAGMEATLFTAVPSRSCFPRGFLWDEGIPPAAAGPLGPRAGPRHPGPLAGPPERRGLDPAGADPGEEARPRVPPSSWCSTATPQPPDAAAGAGAAAARRALPYLRRLYPRLTAWFQWLNRTQAGPEPFTFRWRGRDADPERFLNPKTLSRGWTITPAPRTRPRRSGTWPALLDGAGRPRAGGVGRAPGRARASYRAMAAALSDNDLLDRLHWAPELGTFADFRQPQRGRGSALAPPARCARRATTSPAAAPGGAGGAAAAFFWGGVTLPPPCLKAGTLFAAPGGKRCRGCCGAGRGGREGVTLVVLSLKIYPNIHTNPSNSHPISPIPTQISQISTQTPQIPTQISQYPHKPLKVPPKYPKY
uniref:mannosyl-oligosaccharide glucosidase n=1 Tax=Taeniopygia guttata TaxID=59729 RepID=A0A674HMK4_TAEGU